MVLTLTARLLAITVAFLHIAVAPCAAAQQAGKRVPRIGYLSGGSDSSRDAAFRQGLRELGYVDGQNITIEYRFAEGKFERLPGFAAELVRLNVDLIVSTSSATNRAAQQATQTIPIVIVIGWNPAGTGSATNIARPGGNTTGLTATNVELSGKRLELFREALPKLARVATLWNPDNPNSVISWKNTEAAARALGLQTQPLEVRGPQDFERTFEAARRGRADAVFVEPDPIFVVHLKRLAELAMTHRLPTMYPTREHPESGSLMSYGPNVSDMSRRAAGYVDKILRGAKPGDLPIELPTKFELVINLKTAKALGLTISSSVLLRADQVIE